MASPLLSLYLRDWADCGMQKSQVYLKSHKTMAKSDGKAGRTDGRNLCQAVLRRFMLDWLPFEVLGDPPSPFDTSVSVLTLTGPETCTLQPIPAIPQLIASTIAFLSEIPQPNHFPHGPISNPVAKALPIYSVSTPNSNIRACSTTVTPTADICTKCILIGGTGGSNEEGVKDFTSMVKACIVPQRKGTNFLDGTACNSHVKQAAYHLLESPKLVAGSKANRHHSEQYMTLLHGPPGTGKTSLAQAMTFDAQYHFFSYRRVSSARAL